MYNADDIPINAMWNRSDKELLEYAAIAAGIDILGYTDNGLVVHKDGFWNPLKRDGDALRLVVKCLLRYRVAYTMDDWLKCNEDGYAATRRAIVRYAAQVGFDMVRGDDERT